MPLFTITFKRVKNFTDDLFRTHKLRSLVINAVAIFMHHSASSSDIAQCHGSRLPEIRSFADLPTK